ncbi:MAG: hypothetical protein EOS42_18065 [Mesorhizobium sp.]|nr:MAG: hypothetical protein EOS42_18065 [Mesorhizobium sp.]
MTDPELGVLVHAGVFSGFSERGVGPETSSLLPLWEKVDRRDSAETDEGCTSGVRRLLCEAIAKLKHPYGRLLGDAFIERFIGAAFRAAHVSLDMIFACFGVEDFKVRIAAFRTFDTCLRVNGQKVACFDPQFPGH